MAFGALPPMSQFPLLPQPLRRAMGADARLHGDTLVRSVVDKIFPVET